MTALKAAASAGADAVYLAGQKFGARHYADNFNPEELEEALKYSHLRGLKVYVTVNTLQKDDELAEVADYLCWLYEKGADGVIVQDLGVASLARDLVPKLPLHASTQMTIHNSLGVRELETLGFSRVVLARELHIDEIRSIARNTAMELECFIHGALCFSYSGQCYFSSFLGGHSGNRGRCAQPCRRLYRYRGKEGYYFSTNDFSSIDMLPDLIDAGVTSFKIEGRMKSAEYVARVVGAYRKALDAQPGQRSEAVAEAKEQLKLSFGRVPTRGFLASRQPTDIATPSLRGATGRFLGEIRSISGARITFETRDRLHVGDRVRVQPKSDMAGKAFTVKDLFLGKAPVKAARERSLVAVTAPFSFSVGDAVFKVSSETAFTMSENACLRRLSGAKDARARCDLRLVLDGEILRITGRAAGTELVEEFPLGDLEPSRAPDMEGVLRAQFGKCGDTPFTLGKLEAPGFPPVLIPSARLKDIRRSFYRTLEEKALSGRKERLRGAREAALSSLARNLPATSTDRRDGLAVCVENIRDFHLLHQEGVEILMLPVSRANLHQLPAFMGRLRGRLDQIVWRLPFIIFEEDIPFYRDALDYLSSQGFSCFEASNLCHFPLLEGRAPEISTGYRLFSLNSQAMLMWREMGASAATLYIEDDRENLGDLLAADLSMERRVIIFAPVPVITSKIVIKGVRGDSPVMSDRGDAYTVTTRDGLTTVTADRRFSLTAHRRRLREMGCSSFVADLSGEAGEGRKRILEACIRGTAMEGTSEFNFTMGLV